MAELEQHLLQAQRQQQSRDDGAFRLAVDRCFSLAGIGTVVTGTAVIGQVAVGDRLVVAPRKLPVRVRGLHAQNRESSQGVAGQRLALNLAATGLEKSDIRRGDWVVAESAQISTRRIDARCACWPAKRVTWRTGHRCTCTWARATWAPAWCCWKARPGPGRQHACATGTGPRHCRLAWRPFHPARPIGHAHAGRRRGAGPAGRGHAAAQAPAHGRTGGAGTGVRQTRP
jgi:hypothetical protein